MNECNLNHPSLESTHGRDMGATSPYDLLLRKESAISEAIWINHVHISGREIHVLWLSGRSSKLKLSLGSLALRHEGN